MEKQARINKLKKHVFFELLSETGRVMILVKYSPDVIIGKRGFVGDEKKAGITLAFNDRINFVWDDYGITATLTFGASTQKCLIPVGCIAAIYSPEMKVQLFTAVADKKEARKQSGPEDVGDNNALKYGEEGGKVINVDFVRKKRLEIKDSETEDA
jgi:hypothetical protein